MNSKENVVALVVLIDNCLSTWKITRSWYTEDHEKQITSHAQNLDQKYFTRTSGKICVVGRIFPIWEAAEAWLRTFKAHPDENPLSYADVYCTNRQEWCDAYDGTFKIPVGTKTSEAYLPHEGEYIIDSVGHFSER